MIGLEEQVMTRSLKAVFEKGVLRPLEPLPLKEHELVTVTVHNGPIASEDLLDTEFIRYCESQADPGATLEQVRSALAKIPGSMAEEIIREREDRV
jgi:predicted DNA-binding antitoxin AbrB/MazE fold protein